MVTLKCVWGYTWVFWVFCCKPNLCDNTHSCVSLLKSKKLSLFRVEKILPIGFLYNVPAWPEKICFQWQKDKNPLAGQTQAHKSTKGYW